MAQRYSQADKRKWVSGPSKAPRRPPIKIPEIDNKALIEEHKFTLIGRVTNPSVQKTRALVDFFLQHWKVDGAITGRDLGPHLFQFKFDSEEDLQSILNQSPYHFKRWMMILQRWEPIVSDFFPALLPFWITIHGLPLHYWNDKAIETIGEELGPVDKVDVDRGRIRVWVNGLRPLEMFLDISLPSGDIKQVELEYEDLEKHCFLCYSLSHDKDNCPSNVAQNNTRFSGAQPMGISQTRTRERLEADRRRQDEKKLSRSVPSYQPPRGHTSGHWQRPALENSSSIPEWKEDKNFRFTYGARKDPHYQSLSYSHHEPLTRRTSAKERLSFGKTNTSESHGQTGSRLNRSISRHEWRPIQAGSQTGNASNNSPAQVSHTPSPRPLREGMGARTPASNHSLNGESHLSHERRSALDRLSLPKDRVPLLQDGIANADSGRLQEVDMQYLEENLTVHLSGGSNIPSSSRHQSNANQELYDPSQDRSPIRTLSEDRLHVSLRLGPLRDPDEQEEQDVSLPITKKRTRNSATTNAPQLSSKVVRSTTNRREGKSPVQGTSVKRRRVTKAHPSPRRKLLQDAITTGKATTISKGNQQPKAKMIPASKKKGTDFRSGPSLLP